LGETGTEHIVRALRWASDFLHTETVAVIEHVDGPFGEKHTYDGCLPRFSVLEEVVEADSVDVDLNVPAKSLEFGTNPAEAFA
jgi:hypothetical protein